MSHIVEARTSIKLPVDVPGELAAAKELLHGAIRVVASQLPGGRLDTYYQNYAGFRIKADSSLVIYSDLVWRGIEILVDPATGELIFKGDFYHYEEAASEVQQLIIQTYISLAVQQALQEEGYLTEVSEDLEGKVTFVGRVYA